jgi:hypothetical protein
MHPVEILEERELLFGPRGDEVVVREDAGVLDGANDQVIVAVTIAVAVVDVREELPERLSCSDDLGGLDVALESSLGLSPGKKEAETGGQHLEVDPEVNLG